MRVVGNRVISRYAEEESGREVLDEVLASNASVHLEQMTGNTFSLIIQSGDERVYYAIGAERAAVSVMEQEREVCNRRSEAARLRENLKRAARFMGRLCAE